MSARVTRAGDYLCLGCATVVDGEVAASLWFESGLGLTCLRTHEGCTMTATEKAEEMGWVVAEVERPEADENEPDLLTPIRAEPDEEDPW